MNRETYTHNIKRLIKKRDNRSALYLLLSYLTIILSFTLLYYYQSMLSYVLNFIIIGIMQYRIVMSCHEAVHYGLFDSKSMNEIFGNINCSLVGLNLNTYREQHMTHHRARSISEDSDAYIYLPIINADPGIRRFIVWIFGTIPEIISKFRVKGMISHNKNEGLHIFDINKWGILILNAFLFLLLLKLFNWYFYFIFWLMPILTVAVFLNRTRVFIEHGYTHLIHNKSIKSLNDSPVETIDIVSNRFERFIISPFSFNYHYTHHQIPTMPYYNNKDLQKIFLEKDKNAHFVVDNTYFKMLMVLLRN